MDDLESGILDAFHRDVSSSFLPLAHDPSASIHFFEGILPLCLHIKRRQKKTEPHRNKQEDVAFHHRSPYNKRKGCKSKDIQKPHNLSSRHANRFLSGLPVLPIWVTITVDRGQHKRGAHVPVTRRQPHVTYRFCYPVCLLGARVGFACHVLRGFNVPAPMQRRSVLLAGRRFRPSMAVAAGWPDTFLGLAGKSSKHRRQKPDSIIAQTYHEQHGSPEGYSHGQARHSRGTPTGITWRRYSNPRP